MKDIKKSSKVAALLAAALLMLLLIVTVVTKANQQGIGVQTISPTVGSIAAVNWYPGTTASGDVPTKVVYLAPAYNTTLGIVQTNITIFNNTANTIERLIQLNASNLSSTSGVYSTISVVLPRNHPRYYVNFTSSNGTHLLISTTQTYNVVPQYGTETSTMYGNNIVVSGGKLNDTMAHIALYYPTAYITSIWENSTGYADIVARKTPI